MSTTTVLLQEIFTTLYITHLFPPYGALKSRIAIAVRSTIVHMLIIVYILNVLNVIGIMCLHPTILDDCIDLNQKYGGSTIDPDCYDRCDYVQKHTTNSSDLTIVQLNVRGVISKTIKILHFLNNAIETDIILLCETW